MPIRPFTEHDVPLGMRLKQQAGWNQTEADWRRLLALAPDGCFVAECDGKSTGTVVIVTLGEVAWISMVLVDPAFRGRGVGTALMHHALSFLDQRNIPTVRLDATHLGEPIYRKLDFQDQFDLVRLARAASSAPPASTTATVAQPGDVPAILALDREVTRTDRAALLSQLVRDHRDRTFVLRDGDTLLGYLTARPGANATQLGPAIARSENAGLALLAAALASMGAQPSFIDVPAQHQPWLDYLIAQGFCEQRRFKRMTRGRPVCEDLPHLLASSGPELG